MATYYADFDLGSGDNDGSSWANAFRTDAAFESFWEATVAAGDIIYMMQSTWTLDSAIDFTARDGTSIAPITLIGVKDGTTAAPPTISDWSDANMSGGADDRPTIVCAAQGFSTGDYFKVYNVKFTTTVANGIYFANFCTAFNCKVTQSSGTNDRKGFYFFSAGKCICCEACGLVSTGVVGALVYLGAGSTALYCYAHDGRYGFNIQGNYCNIINCIVEDCTITGIHVGNGYATILNNTIYECTRGIDIGVYPCLVVNNAFKTCSGDGIYNGSGNQYDTNFFWKNAGYENASDVVDMWDGIATTAPHGDLMWTNSDVLLTGAGDSSLQAGSPCIDNGLALTLGVG